MNAQHHRHHQLLILRQNHWLVRADGDDQVVAVGQIVSHQAERFAQQALDTISPDRISNDPADADAQA
jgi:hypothetical protein